MMRLMGDNGKPNDNILTHILSPYPAQRSAITDCRKLAASGSVYRNIHICNNVLSEGNLTVIIAGRDPIRLAPGSCTTQNGNQVTLSNQDSKELVTVGICQVVGRNR